MWSTIQIFNHPHSTPLVLIFVLQPMGSHKMFLKICRMHMRMTNLLWVDRSLARHYLTCTYGMYMFLFVSFSSFSAIFHHYTCMYILTYIRIQSYVHNFTDASTHARTHAHTHTYVQTQIHTDTHRQTQTHTQRQTDTHKDRHTDAHIHSMTISCMCSPVRSQDQHMMNSYSRLLLIQLFHWPFLMP